ncbi:MAG: peptide chain release factor H [Bacteroidales bacterium]|jgi:peptide chain release factor|nr:peptide chain release factor H [Bacteroidales bacterium]
MDRIYLQVTSGRGPAECCRVVAKVLEIILAEAKRNGYSAEVAEHEEGELNRTLFSALVLIQGPNLTKFIRSWEGTVLWISRSPYRKFHKRKNWFVGVQKLDIPEKMNYDERDIRFQTLKASGPGGQHVNKTESAVRAIHVLSGISVIASDSRSQLQNKRLALERLLIKLAAREQEKALVLTQDSWQNHNLLQRGNPIRVFKAELNT